MAFEDYFAVIAHQRIHVRDHFLLSDYLVLPVFQFEAEFPPQGGVVCGNAPLISCLFERSSARRQSRGGRMRSEAEQAVTTSASGAERSEALAQKTD